MALANRFAVNILFKAYGGTLSGLAVGGESFMRDPYIFLTSY